MALNLRRSCGPPGAPIVIYGFVCALIFASAAIAAKKQPPTHPINLNTARLEQLEELPGIGPVTPKSIIDCRTKSGPFKRTEDLLAVPRISKRGFQKIAPYITVGPPAHSKNE